jgi:hypothetical protein
MEPTLVEVTEAQALEAENNRLRAVLEQLRDMAGLQALSALTASPATMAAGLAFLGRLASDALEQS